VDHNGLNKQRPPAHALLDGPRPLVDGQRPEAAIHDDDAPIAWLSVVELRVQDCKDPTYANNIDPVREPDTSRICKVTPIGRIGFRTDSLELLKVKSISRNGRKPETIPNRGVTTTAG
jgi:hypothetical protein